MAAMWARLENTGRVRAIFLLYDFVLGWVSDPKSHADVGMAAKANPTQVMPLKPSESKIRPLLKLPMPLRKQKLQPRPSKNKAVSKTGNDSERGASIQLAINTKPPRPIVLRRPRLSANHPDKNEKPNMPNKCTVSTQDMLGKLW